MSHRISLWMAAAALAAGGLGATRSHAAEPRLDDHTRTSVLAALADERHTEAQYHRTLSDLGSVRPFSNAVRAEGRHAAMLEAVLRAHGEDIPAATATGGAGLASHARLEDACAAAVASEKRNVALYDAAIVPGLPADVARVFEHNRVASLEHHLPAFERCAATAGSGAAAGRGCGGREGGTGCGHRPQGGAGCGHGCGCR